MAGVLLVGLFKRGTTERTSRQLWVSDSAVPKAMRRKIGQKHHPFLSSLSELWSKFLFDKRTRILYVDFSRGLDMIAT